MSVARLRRATVGLVVGSGLLSLYATPADAALPPLLPVSAQPVGVAPVAASTTVDPLIGGAKGTMILVHGGGWTGHSASQQQVLHQTPGDLLVQRGWRVVSIDYDEGTNGLQDVLNAARDELARKSGDGPLCIYGESAGAQLALVAASQLPWIDCVIGLGGPTDLAVYESEGRVDADPLVRLIASRMSRFFGTTTAQLAPWNPVALAPVIRADVMLISEGDDTIVPPAHGALFQAVRQTTQLVALEAGDVADTSTHFVHGTISQAGRMRYGAAIGAFGDRAIGYRATQRKAARTGCTHVSRSSTQIGRRALMSALRCLARKDTRTRHDTGSWQRSVVRMHGEVNAARLWAALRRTQTGRRALGATAENQTTITLHTSDPSRVIVRHATDATR